MQDKDRMFKFERQRDEQIPAKGAGEEASKRSAIDDRRQGDVRRIQVQGGGRSRARQRKIRQALEYLGLGPFEEVDEEALPKPQPLASHNAGLARDAQDSLGVPVDHVMVEITPELDHIGKQGVALHDRIGLAPSAAQDTRVMGHEVGHVVQMGGGSPQRDDVSPSGQSMGVEQEADAASEAIANKKTFHVVNTLDGGTPHFKTKGEGPAGDSSEKAGQEEQPTSETAEGIQEAQDQAWDEELARPLSEARLAMEDATALDVKASPEGLAAPVEFPAVVEVIAPEPVVMSPLMAITPEEDALFAQASTQTPAAHHAQIEGDLTLISGEALGFQEGTMQQALMLADAAMAITQELQASVETSVQGGLAQVDLTYSDTLSALDNVASEAMATINDQHLAQGRQRINDTFGEQTRTIERTFKAAQTTFGQLTKTIESGVNADIQALANDLKTATGACSKAIGREQTRLEGAFEQTFKANNSDGDGDFYGNEGATASAALEADVKGALVAEVARELAMNVEKNIGKQVTQLKASAPKTAEALIRQWLEPKQGTLPDNKSMVEEDSKKAHGLAMTSLEKGADEAQQAVGKAFEDANVKVSTQRDASMDRMQAEGDALIAHLSESGDEFQGRVRHRGEQDAAYYHGVLADLQAQFATVTTPVEYEHVLSQLNAARDGLQATHLEHLQGLDAFFVTGEQDLRTEIDGKLALFGQAVETESAQVAEIRAKSSETILKSSDTFGASLQGRVDTFDGEMIKARAPLNLNAKAFKKRVEAQLKSYRTEQLKPELNKVKAGLEQALSGVHKSLEAQVTSKAPPKVRESKSAVKSRVTSIYDAVDGAGTDESAIYRALRNCSVGEIEYLQYKYDDHYSHYRSDVDSDCPYSSVLWFHLWDDLSGSEFRITKKYLWHKRAEALELELEDSVGLLNDDEARIEEVLRSCSDEELKALNKTAAAKNALDAMGGVDHDVVSTLLDDSLSKQERLLGADAMRLYEAMDGLGTDEAKVEKILEGCKDPKQREMLRTKFQAYSNKQNNGNGMSLKAMIKDDFSGADKHLMVAYSEVERDADLVRVAKIIRAGEGTGTNEKVIFDELEDPAFVKRYAEAKTPAQREALIAERRKKLDELVRQVSEGEYQSMSAFLDDEMGTQNSITYEDARKSKLQPYHLKQINLEREVAERTMMYGKCERDLKLRYAIHGAGTDEAIVKDAISNKGQALPKTELAQLQRDYRKHWSEDAWHWNYSSGEGDETLPGAISNDMSGRDWHEVQILLFGAPENAKDHERIARLNYAFETSGAIGSEFMAAADWMGLTNAHTNLEAQYARFNGIYEKIPPEKRLEKISEIGPEGERLAIVSEYVQADAKAYGAVKGSIADALVTTLQVVGSVAATILTGGAAAPAAAAVLTNIAIGAAGIVIKKVIVGDAYGAEDIALDFARELASAALAGAVELRAVGEIVEKSAAGLAGVGKALSEAAAEKGFVHTGKVLEMGTDLAAKFGDDILKQAGESALEEIAHTAIDDNIWDHKGLENMGFHAAAAVLKNLVVAGVDVKGGKFADRKGVLASALGQAGVNVASSTAGELADVRNWDSLKDFGQWVEHLKKNAAENAFHGALEGGTQRVLGGHGHDHDPSRTNVDADASPDANVSRDPNAGDVVQRPSASELAADPARRQAVEADLSAGLGSLKKNTALEVDPTLPGNEVRVTYDLDDKGLVTNVRVKAGPGATRRDIELHAKTVKLVRKYSGFGGRVRQLLGRVNAFISGKSKAEVGTYAWEAKLELEKLPRILDDRLAALQNKTLNEADQRSLEAEIERIQEQIEFYEGQLDNLESGKGFVAAKGDATEKTLSSDDPAFQDFVAQTQHLSSTTDLKALVDQARKLRDPLDTSEAALRVGNIKTAAESAHSNLQGLDRSLQRLDLYNIEQARTLIARLQENEALIPGLSNVRDLEQAKRALDAFEHVQRALQSTGDASNLDNLSTYSLANLHTLDAYTAPGAALDRAKKASVDADLHAQIPNAAQLGEALDQAIAAKLETLQRQAQRDLDRLHEGSLTSLDEERAQALLLRDELIQRLGGDAVLSEGQRTALGQVTQAKEAVDSFEQLRSSAYRLTTPEHIDAAIALLKAAEAQRDALSGDSLARLEHLRNEARAALEKACDAEVASIMGDRAMTRVDALGDKIATIDALLELQHTMGRFDGEGAGVDPKITQWLNDAGHLQRQDQEISSYTERIDAVDTIHPGAFDTLFDFQSTLQSLKDNIDADKRFEISTTHREAIRRVESQIQAARMHVSDHVRQGDRIATSKDDCSAKGRIEEHLSEIAALREALTPFQDTVRPHDPALANRVDGTLVLLEQRQRDVEIARDRYNSLKESMSRMDALTQPGNPMMSASRAIDTLDMIIKEIDALAAHSIKGGDLAGLMEKRQELEARKVHWEGDLKANPEPTTKTGKQHLRDAAQSRMDGMHAVNSVASDKAHKEVLANKRRALDANQRELEGSDVLASDRLKKATQVHAQSGYMEVRDIENAQREDAQAAKDRDSEADPRVKPLSDKDRQAWQRNAQRLADESTTMLQEHGNTQALEAGYQRALELQQQFQREIEQAKANPTFQISSEAANWRTYAIETLTQAQTEGQRFAEHIWKVGRFTNRSPDVDVFTQLVDATQTLGDRRKHLQIIEIETRKLLDYQPDWDVSSKTTPKVNYGTDPKVSGVDKGKPQMDATTGDASRTYNRTRQRNVDGVQTTVSSEIGITGQGPSAKIDGQGGSASGASVTVGASFSVEQTTDQGMHETVDGLTQRKRVSKAKAEAKLKNFVQPSGGLSFDMRNVEENLAPRGRQDRDAASAGTPQDMAGLVVEKKKERGITASIGGKTTAKLVWGTATTSSALKKKRLGNITGSAEQGAHTFTENFVGGALEETMPLAEKTNQSGGSEDATAINSSQQSPAPTQAEAKASLQEDLAEMGFNAHEVAQVRPLSERSEAVSGLNQRRLSTLLKRLNVSSEQVFPRALLAAQAAFGPNWKSSAIDKLDIEEAIAAHVNSNTLEVYGLSKADIEVVESIMGVDFSTIIFNSPASLVSETNRKLLADRYSAEEVEYLIAAIVESNLLDPSKNVWRERDFQSIEDSIQYIDTPTPKAREKSYKREDHGS